MRLRCLSGALAAAAAALGVSVLAAPSGATYDGRSLRSGSSATTPAPTPLRGRSRGAVPRSLGFDRDGRGLASWAPEFPADRCRPDRSHACWGAIAWFTPSRGWRAGPRLPRNVAAHDLAVGAGGRVALLELLDVRAGKARRRSVIAARLATTRSLRFGRAQRLDSGPPRPSGEEYAVTRAAPRVAVAADGTVVAAWERRSCAVPCPSAAARRASRRTGIVVRERRPGRRFGRTRLLAPGGTGAALRVAADGSGVLAWLGPREARQQRVLARMRTARGAWGPAETVAVGLPYWTTEYVSADGRGGRFAVGVLQTFRRAEGVLVRATAHIRTPDVPGRWTEVPLADYRFTPTAAAPYGVLRPRVVVVVGDDGRIRAAWPQPVDGVMRAMTAEVAPTPSPPLAVSAPGADAIVNDAAAGPGGAFAVTWFDLGGRGSANLAEGGDGALRLSPPLGAAPGLLGARVAYSPRTGRPTVLWAQGASPLGVQPMVWTSPALG